MKAVEVRNYHGGTDVAFVQTEAPNEKAQFAMELMRHLAIAAATPDGEDSAGRARLRLMTPEEVAQRGAQIADYAFEIFTERGWMVDAPLPKLGEDQKPLS